MAESTPRDATPHPPPPPPPRQPLGIGRVFAGICHFVRPGGREFVSKPLPGVRGAYVNFSKAVNIVPFSIFQIKICVFGERKITLASGRWITSSKSHRAVQDPNFELSGGSHPDPCGARVA